MSLFLILACLVAAAALAILLAPLWRAPRTEQESPAANEETRKLRDQLRQLAKRHAEGGIDDKHYNRRKAGLERKLVDSMVRAPAQSTAPAQPSRNLGLALSAFVVAIAAAGYAWVGTPQALTVAGANAGAETSGTQHALSNEQIIAMVDKLAARLKDEPDNVEGWIVLARSYAVMGRHADALPAFRKALALRKDDPTLLADLADTLAVTQGRSLDGEPMRLVEQALKLDPDNVKALSLAGTFAFNNKDYATAIRHWERVLQVAPADSPLAQQMRGGIEEARQLAQGKTPETSAAAIPTPAPAAPAAPAVAAGAAAVTGTVSLAPALAAKASPEDTVFIFARPAAGSRMPLAIIRKQVKDLPFRFELNDSMAMSPQSRISAFSQVVVGARVSKSGTAVPEAGDLQGQSQPVAVGTRDLSIEIRDIVASR
jgi:cytochrome c-type biogenesis protein CcmH